MEKFFLYLAIGVAAYIGFRLFFSSPAKPISDYEKELEDILTSEKYRVKGRFEE